MTEFHQRRRPKPRELPLPALGPNEARLALRLFARALEAAHYGKARVAWSAIETLKQLGIELSSEPTAEQEGADGPQHLVDPESRWADDAGNRTDAPPPPTWGRGPGSEFTIEHKRWHF